MFKGLIPEISRLQASIENLTLRVATLSNDIQINLESLEERLNSRLDAIKEELKQEMLFKGLKT